MIDPQRPDTWRRYRTGMCEGCWSGCCTLPLEVKASDLIRLEVINEDDLAEGLGRIAVRLKKQRIVKSFHQKTQTFILEQKYGRDCIYLGSDRRCTVYEKRPDVCRQFPNIGPRPGYCPATQIKDTKTY